MEGEDSNVVDPLFNFCRLCIVEEGKFIVLPRSHIQNSIRKIFGVTIKPFDGFSRLLCEACKKQLLDIERIRAEYLLNQEILLTLKRGQDQARQNSTSATIIKTEPEDEAPEHAAGDSEKKNTPSPPALPAGEPTNITKTTENKVIKVIKKELDDSISEKSTSDSEFDDDAASPANTEQIQVDKNPQKTKRQSPVESMLASSEQDSQIIPQNHQKTKRQSRAEWTLASSEQDSTDVVYRYHCRLCNDQFDTFVRLKVHLGCHSNLMRLQRRFTPYVCSVRLQQLVKSDQAGSTHIQFRKHPFFFVRVRRNKYPENSMGSATEATHTNEESDGEFGDELAPSDDMNTRRNSTLSLNRSSVDGTHVKSEEESPSGIFEPTIPYNLGSLNSSNFGSILREVYTVLDHDQDINTTLEVNEGLINEYIQQRYNKYCRNEAISELQQAQHILIYICKKRLKVHWKQNNKGSIETVLHFSSLNKKVQNHSNLEGFVEVSKKTVNNSVAKKRVTLSSQSVRTSKHVSVRASNKTKGHAREANGTTSPGSAACTSGAMDNVMSVGRVNSVIDVMGKGKSSIAEVSGTEDGNSSADVVGSAADTSVTLETNSTVTAECTTDATGSVEGNSAAEASLPDWPVIVSTTTLEASAAGTTDCIDLDDGQNTITSDHFQEPVSPIVFFQHVLEKEGLYLSLAPPSQQAISLVCFKKNVDNRGDFVINISIDNYRSFFYLEVWQGKKTIDLSNENFLTQWGILTSMSRPNMETLMNNYAKRFSVNVGIVAKFINIIRSISGTIHGDSILMEAPNKFFF